MTAAVALGDAMQSLVGYITGGILGAIIVAAVFVIGFLFVTRH